VALLSVPPAAAADALLTITTWVASESRPYKVIGVAPEYETTPR